MSTWSLNKPAIGYSRSREMTGTPRSVKLSPTSNMSEDNSSEELVDLNTGKYSLYTKPSVQERLLNVALENPVMRNLQDPMPLMPTFGNKTPELTTLNSNSENERSEDNQRLTGNKSGSLLKQAISMECQRASEYRIIGLSERLAQIMRNRLEWSDIAVYSGVQLVQESHAVLGKKLEWTLILRTPVQSGGMDTTIMNTLLSMNLEVRWMSHTSCCGSTDIRSLWRTKEEVSCLKHARFG